MGINRRGLDVPTPDDRRLLGSTDFNSRGMHELTDHVFVDFVLKVAR